MIHPIIEEFFACGECKDAALLIEQLVLCSRSDICELIRQNKQKPITTSAIPQYSSFDDGTINLIHYLKMTGNFGPSFIEVGKHYLECGHQNIAYIKYGENHSKLAQLLGTVTIKKEGVKRIYLNEIGYELGKRSKEDQHECFVKLAGIVPIVQCAIINDLKNDRELEEVLKNYLSPSTALRRRRNTWYLIIALREEED